jgi:release factor glutamine methyltransferase
MPLIVSLGVFHPGLFVSTPLLLDALSQLLLEAGSSVLDMGTGTGVRAVFAAKTGPRVTAVDVSPLAVRCARVNAILNCLEDQIRVLQGDLFALIGNERYDLVIFNPPYFEGKPKDWPEYAWRGEKVLDRFTGGLRSHLNEGGRVLLSLSTELNLTAIKEELDRNEFEIHQRRKRRLLGETIFLCECLRHTFGPALEVQPRLKLARDEHGSEPNTYRKR